MSIPSLTADAESFIIVPINVDDAKGIAGGDITLTFDETILTAKEARPTALTQSLNLLPNIMAGEVTVSMAGIKGIAEGSGAIAEIVFEVSAAAKSGATIPLTFTEAALYDELANNIPVQTKDGILTIEQEFPRWDVNEDGVVDIVDLVLVGKHFGEDYRQNAQLSPLVGKMRSKDVEGDSWLEAKAGSASILLADRQAGSLPYEDSGKYLSVQLKTTPITDLYGYQFDPGFDSTVLELLTVTASPLLKQDGTQTYWTVSEREALISAMHVRQATKLSINANGTLATIVFRVKDIERSKDSSLQLANIKLADSNAQLIPINIRAIDGNLRRLFIPTKSLLAQNFPNPFNPETWIPYQLSAEANVTIEIYDTQGRLVRIFDLGVQPAGRHLTKGRAVHWNGKNEDGEQVASGVYFYQLKAEYPDSEVRTFSAVRRLVVIK